MPRISGPCMRVIRWSAIVGSAAEVASMNKYVYTVDGHTNPALLALEILERLRQGGTDATINEESFRYVATLIPDFQDTVSIEDIDTLDQLYAFAFEHGFLIRQLGTSIEAVTREARGE